MKKNLFLMIAVLAASPVMGQDAKQIADSLSIPPVKAGAKQLPMPSVSGAQIKLLGADYEQLVNSKGKIAPVISDTPVNVSFKVTKDGKEAVSKDYEIMLLMPPRATPSRGSSRKSCNGRGDRENISWGIRSP